MIALLADKPVTMSGGTAEATPVSETDPNDEEAWKQSPWAPFVESSLKLGEYFGNQGEIEWANWIKKEGFRLSDEEIGKKAKELFGPSDEELETALVWFIVSNRRDRGDFVGISDEEAEAMVRAEIEEERRRR